MQPVSGSNVTSVAIPPMPDGLNTNTGPRSPRSRCVFSYRSARVRVAITAPGASMIRQISSTDFPYRGPPSVSFTSSHDAHTHNQPTLHNRYANSDVGTRNRCQEVQLAVGRAATCASAGASQTATAFHTICHRDANP